MSDALEVDDQPARRAAIAADRCAAMLVFAIVGPLFSRRWSSKEAIGEAFVTFAVTRRCFHHAFGNVGACLRVTSALSANAQIDVVQTNLSAGSEVV